MTALSGYLQIAAIAIGWGSVALIVRLVSAPSQVAVFYRVLFAAVPLLVALAVAGRLGELRLTALRWPAIAMGFCLALHWVCFFAAIRSTSVASAVFATTSTPIFLAGLGPLLLAERPTRATLLATALGLGGVGLMVGVGDSGEVRLEGVALGLLAALVGALIPIAGKFLGVTSNVATITAVQTATATVVLLPLALATGAQVSATDLWLLAILGVVHTALALTLYYRALRAVPVQTAGVLGLLEPLSAATLAWLVLGESPSLATAAGGALIALGVLLVRPRGT